MSFEIELVERQFDKIQPKGSAFVDIFYKNLFAACSKSVYLSNPI